MSGNGMSDNGMNDEVKGRTLSRVGRRPIPIPAGVQVTVDGGSVTVKGPKGNVVQNLRPEVIIKVEDGQVVVERLTERKFHHALHGTVRSIIANAVHGVTEGHRRSLELMGVGYRVQQTGRGITLSVGFTHPVEIQPPANIIMTVEGNNRVHIQGADKQAVNQLAARVRKVRPPNAYKEKGIKYADEVLHFKPGKAAARK